jgi:hypothetical protein
MTPQPVQSGNAVIDYALTLIFAHYIDHSTDVIE